MKDHWSRKLINAYAICQFNVRNQIMQWKIGNKVATELSEAAGSSFFVHFVTYSQTNHHRFNHKSGNKVAIEPAEAVGASLLSAFCDVLTNRLSSLLINAYQQRWNIVIYCHAKK